MNSSPYFVPDGNGIRSDTVSALATSISRGETIRAAVGYTRFEFNFKTIKGHVLITDKAIYAAKDRLIGSPKVDIRVALDSIRSFGAGPLYGVGPTWAIEFNAPTPGFFYVSRGDDAEQVAEILNRSLGGLNDPDLDAFNRSLDASRAAPPGDEGKAMTAAEVSAESQRLRALVASGQLQAAWDARVALGYGVPSDGVPQADRFWIDADPAIAALRLGLKEHPMVAMCCGMAEQNADIRDPAQAQAVELFNQLYHGAPPPSEVERLPTPNPGGDTVNRVYNTMLQAEAGDTVSSIFMDGLALEGQGQAELALAKFIEAAQLGSVDAMREAGVLAHELGRAAESDFWYESAARAGDGVGMWNVAVSAADRGDLNSAVAWFQASAEAGVPDGYAALTQLAADRGDSDAELKWSGLGAAAGQTFCIGRYGLLLAMSANGNVTTLRRARDYLEQAAERGHIDSASLAVGINSELGEPARGRRFIEQVVASGDQDQIDRLRRWGFL